MSIDRRLSASRRYQMTQADILANLTRSTSAVFLSAFFQREQSRLLGLFRRLVADCPGFRVRLGRDLMTDPTACLDHLVSAADTELPLTE